VIRRIAKNAGEVPISAATFHRAMEAIDKGLARLKGTQSASGAWMEGESATNSAADKSKSAASGAVTALAVRAFAQRGWTPQGEPALERGAARLVALVSGPDGFGAGAAGGMSTYVAACTAMALAALQDPRHERTLAEAVTWIRKAQYDEATGISPTQDWYGGAGYGIASGRPDLSNTQFMLDALHEANATAKDPAVERAVVFLTRCQNLKSTNAAAWAQAGAGDGGMVYTAANDGESLASEAAGDGRMAEKMPPGTRALRSYGSMTYAGYKSMLFAGLPRSDPRVRAALEWIERHFTFGENPGLGQQGYYYYVHAAARALLACGKDQVVDDHGASHNWREELIDALSLRQRPDGSWQNPETRWMEGQADLATVFAVLALEEAIKPVTVSQ
jgi:squalene-hopene/tetraprenyl-beta-curcumene cyclase